MDFCCFSLFLDFSKKFIKKVGQKLGNNRCPLFTMLTKQNSSMFCIVSFVKNKKENDLIILGDMPLLKKSGLFSEATGPHILKMVYFQGRPTHTLTLVCFQGRPAHTLTLVYFHGRPSLLIGFIRDPIWRSNKNKDRCVARST